MVRAYVLMLSGHYDSMDRRIVAEANALAECGLAVTLVSVPAEVPVGWMNPSIRLVQPPGPRKQSRRLLHQYAARFATYAPAILNMLRGWLRPSRMKARSQLLLDLTPAHNYDVIHCHDLDTLPAGQLIRTRMAPGAKLIYDSHELYPYQLRDWFFRRYWAEQERRYIHLADRVITVNESIADQLRDTYGIARPVVLYNSCGNPKAPLVTPEQFARHFSVPLGGFRVLFQGNFSPLRNLPNLVQAFRRLPGPFQLLLLGRGPLERQLRDLCARESCSNVFFGAHVPQEDLLGYTRNADLGIIPYEEAGLLNMRYCTPNKLFEYIEACVPVCASDLPELKRIIEGGSIGKTYPMRSPDEIALGIRDCWERIQHGEFRANRKQVQQQFAWSHQRTQLLNLYDQLGLCPEAPPGPLSSRGLLQADLTAG